MTKKHFIALADVLRELKPVQLSCDKTSSTYQQRIGAIEQWRDTCEALQNFCEKQNPAFDRDKWLNYICGIK